MGLAFDFTAFLPSASEKPHAQARSSPGVTVSRARLRLRVRGVQATAVAVQATAVAVQATAVLYRLQL